MRFLLVAMNGFSSIRLLPIRRLDLQISSQSIQIVFLMASVVDESKKSLEGFSGI